ncbi:TonB-dependent receptor [Leptolyngbya sp. 15MV]|nr:TonB-dependent receptor [Leptolyngbya sp. 15MV]
MGNSTKAGRAVRAQGLAGSSALALAILAAAPAIAQDAPPTDESVIIVSGQRGALNEAIAAERNADNLRNVVTADDVGQFGDQNSAEALQRLPGVTIERNEGEGRTVSIRGLPSDFTQVTVNGARLGTSEAGSSTVALDVIPSDLLGSIEVSKTYTPDMDGDTIGGSVELKSLSAFDRAGDITTLRLEGSMGEYAEKVGPKASGSLARKFANDTIGVALTGSYFKRFVEGDDLRNEDSFQTVVRNGTTFLYPREVNQRFEVGDRTRYGGTLNLEYRPNDGDEYFLRTSLTRLEDNDIRIQSQWQTERATGSEIQEISEGGGRFIDVRLRNQIFFQPTTDRQFAISGGHKTTFGALRWSSQVDFARSRWTQRDGVRGRFQIDDIGQVAEYDRDSAFTEFFRDRTRPDPFNIAAYEFQSFLFIEEERIDEIFTAGTNLAWDVDGNNELKFGVKYRQRDKSADKEEYNGNPPDFGIIARLDQFPLLTRQPRFQTFGPFPALPEAYDLFISTRDQMLQDPRFFRADNSVASDYTLGEDVLAFYGMGTFNLSDSFRLIAGVRVEQTDFESTGFFLEADGEGNAMGAPVIPIFLGTATRKYTDWLPSLVMRWDATDRLLVRASYGKGVKRPEFGDATNRQRVSFDTTNPMNTRDLVAGNPDLEALTAHNFDVSLSFYPSRTAVVQVALFHKEIRNFFIDFETNDLSQAPITIPDTINRNFRSIETVINGAKARVSGIELSYSQTFPQAPGILSGLFFSGNMTLVDSKAEIDTRPDESFAFPGQADITGNFSLGYEDNRFSLRGSVNHRGKTLAGVSGTTYVGIDGFPNDRFRAAYTQYDINVRFKLTDWLQLYADAINITGEKDIRYYVGNNFPLYERVQDFGATYQFGARMTF